ncbi:MAG: hypothetical protein CL927_18380 [Deltaproteobacteria bacterium]|nr:hypothetical protein [Deltaproteobacteria bacterium]HCH61875.1 hypothetical protein [Deltaproteobacteria bacterium]
MLRPVLAFLAGFVAYFITTGLFYGVIVYDAQMEIMAANPESFHADPKIAMVLIANALWVGMIQYVVTASSKKTVAAGAAHGAITLLLVNGGFNFLLLGAFKFLPTGAALLDIAANVPFGAAAGAAIAFVLGRK